MASKQSNIYNDLSEHWAHQNNRYVYETLKWNKPTHFITIRLLNNAEIHTETGWVSKIQCDDVVLTNVYWSLMRSFSKRLTAPSAWKRNKTIIPNIGFIGGNGKDINNHFHIFVALPNYIDEITLEEAVLDTCVGNAWAEKPKMQNRSSSSTKTVSLNNACVIKNISDFDYKMRSMHYGHNHGADRIILA